MYWLIALLALCVFAIGVFVGVRCEASALRYRERRLYLDRCRLNAQMRALYAHNEVKPSAAEPQFEHATIPSQQNGAKSVVSSRSPGR